ncbi:prolipoprotein diacylglyceryl transferase [Candidatus Peregrinibacteria bacterium]|nr:prolipoprotein diacylglyceryl transferase [Candidatus Peregrinibacteria bacterium]
MIEVLEFGPLMIWTHLMFLLLGVWLSTEFCFRLAEGSHLSLHHFQQHGRWYVCAFILGGRGIAILADYRVYLRDLLRIFIFWDGNFSFLGGVIGVGIVLFVVTREHRSTFLQWLDVLVPSAALGIGFDWLGKLAAGQAYGKPTDMPWGVIYDSMSVRYTVPVHPVQLYYVLFFLLLTFVLLVVRKYARRAGTETLVGVISAAAAVLVFENFRGDFGILVFAVLTDFLILLFLFSSAGFLIPRVKNMSSMVLLGWGGGAILVVGLYLAVRGIVPVPTVELRMSQFLAVLSLLATVVYVIVHRVQHPHV